MPQQIGWSQEAKLLYQLQQQVARMGSGGGASFESYASLALFPIPGDAATIYLALDTNQIYYWNDTTSSYVEISTASSFPYLEVTGAYVIAYDDYVVNCTTGTFNVTLPTATLMPGKAFLVKNSGAGLITVDTTGGETIDGVASITIVTNESLWVQSTGTNWIRI